MRDRVAAGGAGKVICRETGKACWTEKTCWKLGVSRLLCCGARQTPETASSRLTPLIPVRRHPKPTLSRRLRSSVKKTRNLKVCD